MQGTNNNEEQQASGQEAYVQEAYVYTAARPLPISSMDTQENLNSLVGASDNFLSSPILPDFNSNKLLNTEIAVYSLSRPIPQHYPPEGPPANNIVYDEQYNSSSYQQEERQQQQYYQQQEEQQHQQYYLPPSSLPPSSLLSSSPAPTAKDSVDTSVLQSQSTFLDKIDEEEQERKKKSSFRRKRRIMFIIIFSGLCILALGIWLYFDLSGKANNSTSSSNNNNGGGTGGTGTGVGGGGGGGGSTLTSAPSTSASTPTSTLVSTFAGTSVAGYLDSTNPLLAQFSNVQGVAIDSNGNVIVADDGNSLLRMISSTSQVSTIAGSAGIFGFQNGNGNQAQFDGPIRVSLDALNNIYVSDYQNNLIRFIPTGTNTVSTFAGTANASLVSPVGLGFYQGNLFVCDFGNNIIKKFSNGIESIFAGVPGKAGVAGGPATSATFNGPNGIAFDSAGNAYVADYNSNLIRKIDLNGIVSIFAGQSIQGFADGLSGTAKFAGPGDIVFGSKTSLLYVSDYSNNAIRILSLNGTVTTIPIPAGVLQGPAGLAIDPISNAFLLVSNSRANQVTKILLK